jgi:hypothetical protein
MLKKPCDTEMEGQPIIQEIRGEPYELSWEYDPANTHWIGSATRQRDGLQLFRLYQTEDQYSDLLKHGMEWVALRESAVFCAVPSGASRRARETEAGPMTGDATMAHHA